MVFFLKFLESKAVIFSSFFVLLCVRGEKKAVAVFEYFSVMLK